MSLSVKLVFNTQCANLLHGASWVAAADGQLQRSWDLLEGQILRVGRYAGDTVDGTYKNHVVIKSKKISNNHLEVSCYKDGGKMHVTVKDVSSSGTALQEQGKKIDRNLPSNQETVVKDLDSLVLGFRKNEGPKVSFTVKLYDKTMRPVEKPRIDEENDGSADVSPGGVLGEVYTLPDSDEDQVGQGKNKKRKKTREEQEQQDARKIKKAKEPKKEQSAATPGKRVIGKPKSAVTKKDVKRRARKSDSSSPPPLPRRKVAPKSSTADARVTQRGVASDSEDIEEAKAATMPRDPRMLQGGVASDSEGSEPPPLVRRTPKKTAKNGVPVAAPAVDQRVSQGGVASESEADDCPPDLDPPRGRLHANGSFVF